MSSFRRWIPQWHTVGSAVVIAAAIVDSFAASCVVSDDTMKPLLDIHAHRTDSCVVFALNKHWSGYNKGDVVVLRDPTSSSGCLTRRLVAAENEWVRRENTVSMHVPTGHCAVFQDNIDSDKLIDSSTFGPLPLKMIQGKVVAVVWPLSMWKIVN